MMLDVSVDEQTQVVATIYEDRRHMPKKVWVDQFHDRHTFLRGTFEKYPNYQERKRLHDLRRMLLSIYCKDADVTIVVHSDGDMDLESAAAHSRDINAIP